MTTPILQFGTSRFLLAHVDLFISEALAAGDGGQALGGITIVQSTGSPASRTRVQALASGEGYPVRIRGLEDGQVVDRTIRSTSIERALGASEDWPALRDLFGDAVLKVVVSNTADRGYLLHDGDNASSLLHDAAAPTSFPAKLLVLLHGRWRRCPSAPLTLLPCELIERNGEVLRDTVAGLAAEWRTEPEFVSWLERHCVWANSLVDRIVSEAIEPVGAVAEPYALWAVETQPGLVLPCRHPAIVLTQNLDLHERLKLFLLNAAHTFLAERWLADGRPAQETVLQAMNDPALGAELEALWQDEILPVFAARGESELALSYLVSVRERFRNPFLAHRLADIAQNHQQKKQRRLAPIVALAEQVAPGLAQDRLRLALGRIQAGYPT
ncbi:tagaturonate reductase [Comamonas sp. BIGb0124]|uniref:mannitol dehydrogenase family protein n=1 Tax=Comamonas sp. BIGb0124 TaxID=2485130 RepID=UPI000F48FC9F|nr:mannitol dehydrogenase family protein [Comamonas sp. BIGb0124]ROR24333.1 tagaturonate reductase [Comamonas sp. BIGb0124]